MKSGEVWRYKNWLAQLIDSHLLELTSEEVPSSFFVRVVISTICEDNVHFHEVNTTDSEYTMQRSTFVEIFEKDWDTNDD